LLTPFVAFHYLQSIHSHIHSTEQPWPQFLTCSCSRASAQYRVPFPHTKKTRHSSRWDHGDWTDDSDQMILILESILETYAGANALATDLHPDPQLFAHKLAAWVDHGFPMLGDRGGMGLGALTKSVVWANTRRLCKQTALQK